MVITSLGGGLGNQMFQYALGRKMAIKNNDLLLLDISVFDVNKSDKHYRHFSLKHFKITNDFATPEQIRALKYPYGNFVSKIRNRLERMILNHDHVGFEPYILKKTGPIYLAGFWQSEKYFKDIRNVLLKEFSLRESFTKVSQLIADNIQGSKNSVSLHVRRGDFVESEQNLHIYGSYCDQNYYNRALTFLAKERDTLSVFVFSDDVEWVRKNIIIPHDTTYISETESPDYERLALMSLCDLHIIANSTFGWWGSWLDNKPGKIVIGPSVWIPGQNLSVDDILPVEWIRM